jgi:hypothetical protein
MGVSSTTASHSTRASLPNRPARSSLGDSEAVPRTPTRERTSCSGPSSSTPSRSSSYGAMSMKSSAASRSSSIEAGSCDGGQVGQHRDVGHDAVGELEDRAAQHVEVLPRHRRRRARAGRRSRRRRPCTSARVDLVDQLELDEPRIEGVGGQRQPHPAADDRLAAEPGPVPIDRRRELVDGELELVAAGPQDRVGLGERREHRPHRLHLGRAPAAELGSPAAVVEHGAGQPVDERGEDVVGARTRTVPADRRRRRRQLGDERRGGRR